MYTLRKQFRFEASHQLEGHDGKCARLHGHSWVGWVELRGRVLVREGPKTNMLVDYGDISAFLKPMVEDFLDHYHLNETLHCKSPTSEYVATWVYGHLVSNGLVPLLDVRLIAVEVEETCTSACRYEP